MQAIFVILLAHLTFFCTLGALILQEFFANNPSIKGNSMGQAVYNYVYAWLQARSKPVLALDASAGK